MARPKKLAEEQPKEEANAEMQKVLVLFKEEGGGYAQAFGILEVEIDKALLIKHSKTISKTEPDIFGIFTNNLIKKARETFNL